MAGCWRQEWSPGAKAGSSQARGLCSQVDRRTLGRSRSLSTARGRSFFETAVCGRSRSPCRLRVSAHAMGIVGESPVIQAGRWFDPGQHPATSHKWHGPSGPSDREGHPVAGTFDRTDSTICLNHITLSSANIPSGHQRIDSMGPRDMRS